MRAWLNINNSDKENKNKSLNDMFVKPQELIAIAAKYRDLGYGIVGVDLAGKESESSSKDEYNVICNEAKNKYNLHITIHAGEANNVNYTNIYDVIENMNAARIEHGYETTESSRLVADLSVSNLDVETLQETEAESKECGKYSHIHVECCPTSSIITKSVHGIQLLSEDYLSHPIRYFNDKNINYGLSTDDPQVLHCSYQRQLLIAHNRMDISISDIKKSIIRAAKEID